jgi:hypothetical protein
MSHIDELTRLAELHRDGDLTDEEFAAAKKKVIEASDNEFETTFFNADIPHPDPVPTEPPSKKWGMTEGCGLGCLGLLIVFGIGLFIFSHDDKSDNKSSDDRTTALNNEKFDVYFVAETIVSQYLKSPSSAEFPNWRGAAMVRNTDGSWLIYSSFEGTNSFGAKLQSHFRITMRKDAQGWKADAPPWIENVE